MFVTFDCRLSTCSDLRGLGPGKPNKPPKTMGLLLSVHLLMRTWLATNGRRSLQGRILA